MGHLFDRRYLNIGREGDEEIYKTKIDATVIIIQITGLLITGSEMVSYGAVFNSRGEIVGVLVSSFETEFHIVVHVRVIATFFQIIRSVLF